MRYAKKTSKSFLALWLLIDLAVIGFVTLQWLGWPGSNPDAGEEEERQYARFPGDLRDEGDLKVGDLAPDFQLATADGKDTVALSSFRDRKPVVLIFGSYSCPIFRHQFSGLKQLCQRYRGEAEFFVVYIQEAHPVEGRRLPENEHEGIQIAEHKTLEERRQAATRCAAALDFKLPVLVDTMDNKLREDYTAWPIRLYVVGEDGLIALKGNVGPERFTLAEMLGTLDGQLRASAAAGPRVENASGSPRPAPAAVAQVREAEPVVAGG